MVCISQVIRVRFVDDDVLVIVASQLLDLKTAALQCRLRKDVCHGRRSDVKNVIGGRNSGT